MFSDQVKKHEELVNIIKQNCLAQDNILQSLTEANAEIGDLRTQIGTTFEKYNEEKKRIFCKCFSFRFSRNRVIQEYINSFKSFEDTLLKANEGIEFYKKVI